MMGVEWSAAEAIKSAYEEGLSMDGCCERDNPSNWEASSAKANLSKAMQLRPMEEAPKDGTWVLVVICCVPNMWWFVAWDTIRGRWTDVLGDSLDPLGWITLPDPSSLEVVK